MQKEKAGTIHFMFRRQFGSPKRARKTDCAAPWRIFASKKGRQQVDTVEWTLTSFQQFKIKINNFYTYSG